MKGAPLLRIEWRPFALELATPIETAHGSIEVRRGFLVRIEDAAGLSGIGEASPLPGFGTEDVESCGRALRRLGAAVLRGPGASGDLEAALGSLADGAWLRADLAAPCARAALDGALHDLAARRVGLPLCEWLVQRVTPPRTGAAWGQRPARTSVPVHALVTGRTPGEVARSAEALRASGPRAFKLKVARTDAADHERVAALRGAIGAGDRIRLDANGGWKTSEALGELRSLAPFDIEFVEQPCPADDLEGLGRLRSASPIPIAADEALLGGQGPACLERGAADVYVVKPAALGGLEPARRLAQAARLAGCDVVVTSFLESAIGVAGALHFAASLPDPLSQCGLAATDFRGTCGGDLAELGAPARGQLDVPQGAGLGIVPSEERLEAAVCGPAESVTV